MPGHKDSYPYLNDSAGNARPEYTRPGLARCRKRCEQVSLSLPADHTRQPEIVIELEDRNATIQHVNLSLADATDLHRQLGDRIACAARLARQQQRGAES